jgi:hypothetical protein
MLDVTASFLDNFIGTNPYVRRCVTGCDTNGQPLSNYKGDVSMYNQGNNGIATCEEGYERDNLALEGNQQPVNISPQAMADQRVAQMPGSMESVARGFYVGREMAPVVPGQAPGARPGLTGYIPSAEEALAAGATNGVTGSLMMVEMEPTEELMMQSAMRRGLLR